MRYILALLLLASPAFGQIVPPKVPVKEAQEGFVKDDTGKVYPLGRIAPSAERLKAVHRASWTRNGFKIQMLAARAVPEAYDSEAFGLIPPVKDQADCGSCHIFSACGPATVAHIKVGNIKNDGDGFSEQHFLDCHRESGGCGGGWEWDDAEMLLQGGPFEREYGPYQARANNCRSYTKKWFIADMGMCSQGSGIASTADMQAAIVQYGSVSVAVAADNAFASYRGGDWNGSGSRSINHAVMLTGWKTVNGTVYWKLRNSWSSGWGVKGYMWIKAGANQVGDSAFWVRAAAINPPLPPDPPVPPIPPDPPIPPIPPGPIGVKTVRLDGFGPGVDNIYEAVPRDTMNEVRRLLEKLSGKQGEMKIEPEKKQEPKPEKQLKKSKEDWMAEQIIQVDLPKEWTHQQRLDWWKKHAAKFDEECCGKKKEPVQPVAVLLAEIQRLSARLEVYEKTNKKIERQLADLPMQP